MGKWNGAMVLLMVLCLSAPPVLAEFYKYRDKNGVLRFTDDLSVVPPNQRPKVDTYKGVGAQDPGAAPAGSTGETEKTPGVAGSGADSQAGEKETAAQDVSDIQATRARLEEMRKKLEQERTELARMKQALQEERAQVETEQDARAYDENVQKLNERIADYEQRRSAFTQQAEALNAARNRQ